LAKGEEKARSVVEGDKFGIRERKGERFGKSKV
jgi:hypothetical protein